MPRRTLIQVADNKPKPRRRRGSSSTGNGPRLLQIAGLAGLLFLGLPVTAPAEEFIPSLVIKNHRFEPAELHVPANVKFKLIVKNQDPTPEEFESYELKREKVVRGNGELTLFIGPLAPGTYAFFGDFHQDSAQGRLIAR